MVQLNDQFPSIDAARKAIKAFVLDQGESYKLVASDKRRYIISCKDGSCKFCIRATRSAKEVVSITIFVPHSCSPQTHNMLNMLLPCFTWINGSEILTKPYKLVSN